MPESLWGEGRGTPIGDHLTPDLFTFKREIPADVEGRDHLEANLFNAMPYIVTARWPALVAAQINTQVEFDRTFRTIVKSDEYRGHHLLFIAGLNIDVSPKEGQLFPLTKFVPWAAYIQAPDGTGHTLEQAELVDLLREQSVDNPPADRPGGGHPDHARGAGDQAAAVARPSGTSGSTPAVW